MRFELLYYRKVIRLNNFQFSLWDSEISPDGVNYFVVWLSILFMRFIVITPVKFEIFEHFQFSLWDSGQAFAISILVEKTFQFSLWDSPKTIKVLRIWVPNFQFSLWDSSSWNYFKICFRYTLSILFMRF